MSNTGQNFAKLLVTHDRELRRYIMLLMPRPDDVEEILQETAVALWEKFAEYDPDLEFLPWAKRFAYFEVLNFRKRHARSRLVYSEDVLKSLAETHNELASELEQRRKALRDCLAGLDPQDRSLIEHHYNKRSAIKELAEELGRTVKALYRRLDRIRQLLADCVDRKMSSVGSWE